MWNLALIPDGRKPIFQASEHQKLQLQCLPLLHQSRFLFKVSHTTNTTLATNILTFISGQPSKPKAASVTEAIAMQLKKTTRVTNLIDMRKDVFAPREDLLIKSPGSFKPKKEKVGHVQKNFYESHSSKLLHQIDNIDLKDGENPLLLAEYVNDIYAYLFKLENTFTIRENFLANQMDVTPKMRTVLLDWINEVHNQFSLELETYQMTVSMIDRFLQSTSNTARRFLQLVGVTALFMASKYEELMPPEISDFVYVTGENFQQQHKRQRSNFFMFLDDTYSKEQILDMEKKIFKALGFNLAKPLPIHFLRRFAKAAGPLGDRQYIAAKYFMELSSLDYEMTKYNPSQVRFSVRLSVVHATNNKRLQIAASSLYLSLYIFNSIKSNDDLWTPTLEYYTTYSSDELMPIMKRLATVVASAKDVKLKSVFTKYSHASYKFTSTLPDLNGSKINEIMNSE